MRWVRAVACASFCLALINCDGDIEVVGQTVPFKYRKAPAPPALTGEEPTGPDRTPDTPECREGTFEVSAEASDAEMEIFKVHLSNDQPVCYLQHAPGLNITPADGASFMAGRVKRELPAFLLYNDADFRATLYVEGCSAKDPEVAPFDASLVMKDGATFPLGTFVDDGCPDGTPRDLRLGGWVLYPPPVDNSLDDVRVDALDVPEQVRGEILRFNVQVTNEGDEELVLDPCPVYRATFGEDGTTFDAISYLNCEEAPDPIEAGEAVRFAIELPLEGEPIGKEFTGSLSFSLFDQQGGSSDLETHPEITVASD